MDTPATAQTAPWATAFARDAYLMVAGMLSPSQTEEARRYLEGRWTAGTLLLENSQGTPIASIYGTPELDGLMETIRSRVEYCTGLLLYPTYSYARVYRNGDRLPPHRDRAACEISISVNLGQTPDEPWTLYVRDRSKKPAGAVLQPGDALIYRGIELTHWREPYEGDTVFQIFMHYVDQNGRHARERFDGRPALGTPPIRT
jgi:alkylated DNA repair dioxygenase AlkB